MSEDISEIIQKMNNMIQNNQIPDEFKNMLNQFSNNNSSNNNSSYNNSSSDNSLNNNSQSNNSSNNNSSEMLNFDMDTLLKMKSIMDNVNSSQSDPRSNLLRSLKPYLRESRKNKVDEYIKLFRMGKIFEMMNPSGGEKKNDV